MNNMYIASYDPHMSVHMILIWSATCDTRMFRYTNDSHFKGRVLIDHTLYLRLLCVRLVLPLNSI